MRAWCFVDMSFRTNAPVLLPPVHAAFCSRTGSGHIAPPTPTELRSSHSHVHRPPVCHVLSLQPACVDALPSDLRETRREIRLVSIIWPGVDPLSASRAGFCRSISLASKILKAFLCQLRTFLKCVGVFLQISQEEDCLV